MEKKIEDMIEEVEEERKREKEGEKPTGKKRTRGRMSREERESVRVQLRVALSRGGDKETCMNLFQLSQKQFKTLMAEIRKENIRTVQEVGADFIGGTIRELIRLKELVTNDYYLAKDDNPNAKIGYMNNITKIETVLFDFMKDFGVMEGAKIDAAEEVRRAKDILARTPEEYEEEERKILESLSKRNKDGRFDKLLKGRGYAKA